MSVNGWGSFGAGGFGPSQAYLALPFRGYRDQPAWVEAFIDAFGDELDILYNKYIRAQAKANLLDPAYTPTEVQDSVHATATTPPDGAISRDTMVDVQALIALGLYPLDSNLTVAQKQALAAIGWSALRRKGTRLQLLNLAAQITGGVAVGWTTPPYNFSIILPDGAPSPGYGSWVPATSSIVETSRPWILAAVRNTLSTVTPGFINLGVGLSQFRWGYSSWGETMFPVGCRLNILTHEHFDAWVASVPTGWTKTGTGTLTQSTSAPSINWEFTGNAAVLDLTGAANGVSIGLSQTAANINSQYTHKFEFDYSYTNTQSASVLTVQITDANANGTTYYWTGSAWTSTATNIVVPVSSSRGRFAIDVVPQSASQSSTLMGTSALTAKIFATSDGTATTQRQYTLYRVGLYEKFSLAIESAALGERTAWHPLVDAPGWTTCSRASDTVTLLEEANASKTAYKSVGATSVSFPYHSAIGGRGFSPNSSWTNLLKGSNDFGADWSLSSATRTANTTISPLVGETVASAPTLSATSTNAAVQQGFAITPANKSYVGGVFVKKLSADSNFTDVTLTLSATTIWSTTFTLKQSQGWQLLPIQVNFGGSEVNTMNFKIGWGAASSNGQIAVASSYLYDVTNKSGVLYPPITQTAIGSTGTLNATVCKAVTATTDTNVLHPLLQRTMASVIRGELNLTIVPSFDAASQPGLGVIFDVAQAATQNRVLLRVSGGARNLQLIRWDNAGNTWTANIPMTTNANPSAGSMTWLRDAPITIHCLWDNQQTMLSAGNGSASGTKPGSWAPSDASVATYRIGCDLAGANQFDGIIAGVEVVQLGAPTT